MLLRKWQLPNGVVIHRHEETPSGQSYFWYCFECGEVYARAPAYTSDQDDAHNLPYVAISGCCAACSGNRWAIPGSLETIKLVGWKVPIEVAHYQLDCEIAFLDHPDHPHNRRVCE